MVHSNRREVSRRAMLCNKTGEAEAKDILRQKRPRREAMGSITVVAKVLNLPTVGGCFFNAAPSRNARLA